MTTANAVFHIRKIKMSTLAQIISSFISKSTTSQSVEPATLVEEKNSGIEITEEFKKTIALIESNAPFVFITGRAGTGKSTFTNLIKDKLKSYAIVAPTGVAALNVGGQTIHSFFKLAPTPVDLLKIKRVSNRTAYQALKTLIIDEISMVRADLLDAIDLMLRLNSRDPKLPFGGVQIIAIGDLFQLPPIVSTEEEQVFIQKGYSSPFFFGANALKEVNLDCIEFTKIFRQTEQTFIQLLNKIREGKELSETLPSLNQRVTPLFNQSFDGIVLTATNDTASKINSKHLADIESETQIYTGTIVGEFRVDKAKLPAPLELTLKPGARVMFVKNDGGKRWVNGTIGIVAELGPNHVLVELNDHFGKRTLRVEPEKWDNSKFEYNADENAVVSTKIGSYTQIPLTLAWAVTIHKSQGKTFDKVHIDLGRGAFAEGQVYVALSRCRTLDGVSLERAIKKEDIRLDFDVIEFYSKLNETNS